MADRFITLRDTGTGETETHVAGHPSGNYATLCGCSSDDDALEAVSTPRGAKISCRTCLATFLIARQFRLTDFHPTAIKHHAACIGEAT